jgi:hypothetical protein
MQQASRREISAFGYVHPFDQAVAQRVDVLDVLLGDLLTIHVVDELTNLDHDASFVIAREPRWLDLRVDEAELPRPVFAHRGVAVLAATLHGVRPIDVGVHQRENGVDVALNAA